MTHFLKLKVIWDDPDLIEVNIHASNHRFSGITDAYLGVSNFPAFLDVLQGFPRENDSEPIIYDALNDTGGFSLKLELTTFGPIVACIKLSDIKRGHNNELYLEMQVETAAIDIFF